MFYYQKSGESGAGKTENTKKVIMYFARVAANIYKGDKHTGQGQVKSVVSDCKVFPSTLTFRSHNSMVTLEM